MRLLDNQRAGFYLYPSRTLLSLCNPLDPSHVAQLPDLICRMLRDVEWDMGFHSMRPAA